MTQLDKKAENKKKRKIVYAVGSALIAILFIMIAFPPVVALFDRNDIWIGPFPLSQVYITGTLLLTVLVMAVMYHFDKKYSSENDKGGDE
ncbi:MAG: hypothetical protein ACOX7J_00150 [Bacillota bacterium]